METMLVVVTVIAVALALAMGALLWRQLREERQRADARVAALVDGFAQQPAANDASSFVVNPPIEQIDLSTDTDWLSQFPSATEAATQATASPDARPMFGHVAGPMEEAEVTGESNRLFSAGVAASLLVGLMLAIWIVTHLVITMASASSSTPALPASTPAASTSASTAAPLELLTLRHDRDGDNLTISGRVRNPPNGARQDRLVAVIFFFNQRGEFQTSVRAPLDYRVLAPGDESPFQVSTPAPAGASRFRVSFRHDEGDVVPHVDRRQAAAGS